MNNIVIITPKQKTGFTLNFDLIAIYETLKNTLGFRYAKIGGKGYYLQKNSDGLFEIVNFHKLTDGFRIYIRENFVDITSNKEIAFSDFMNVYYKKRPLKDSNLCKKHLGANFELTVEQEHLVKMKIDNKYRIDFNYHEMCQFLKEKGFTETVDKVGNFSKDKPLFYKKLKNENYIAFNQPFSPKKGNSCTFDFWRVKAQSEKEFLKQKLDERLLFDIRLGFDLREDIELYHKAIKIGH